MSSEDFQALIVPGRVLLLHCNFLSGRPKHKLYLVVATEPFAIGFLINSELTDLQMRRADLRAEQIKLAPGAFLSHDSYLDCTCPIDDFELEEIIAQISSDPRLVKSVASDQLMARVHRVVSNSLMIERGKKQIILRNIERHFPGSGITKL